MIDLDLVVPLKATAQARHSITRHGASNDATTLSPVLSYIGASAKRSGQTGQPAQPQYRLGACSKISVLAVADGLTRHQFVGRTLSPLTVARYSMSLPPGGILA